MFEDQLYTNSRTYFWALQSLRVINECITSLVTAWNMYDKMSLLDLLPDDVAGSSNPDKKACPYVAEIDSQMEQLGEMIKANNAKQEEIRALRDGVSITNLSLDFIRLFVLLLLSWKDRHGGLNASQRCLWTPSRVPLLKLFVTQPLTYLQPQLFNASAVLEARTTVTQGQNIRILTLISMLFLPASFVASVFGMQSILPPSTSLHTFAIVISVICGPTYLLILFMDATAKGMRWKRSGPAKGSIGDLKTWRWLKNKTRTENNDTDVEKGVEFE